jgi:hypothetical protein
MAQQTVENLQAEALRALTTAQNAIFVLCDEVRRLAGIISDAQAPKKEVD